jgi:hypothetical protein
MGDIVKRDTKDEPRFYIRFKDNNGQRVQRVVKGAITVAEAREVLAAAELRVSQGQVGIVEKTDEERARAAVTLAQLVDRFNAEYRPRVSEPNQVWNGGAGARAPGQPQGIQHHQRRDRSAARSAA